MSDKNIELIGKSFPRVFARKATLTDRFYYHLLVSFPDTKVLLAGGFWEQKELFAKMLAGTIRGLLGPGGEQNMVNVLRVTHSRFNLTWKHLDAFSSALTMALQDVMMDDLTDQEESAWKETIAKLARAMAPDQS